MRGRADGWLGGLVRWPVRPLDTQQWTGHRWWRLCQDVYMLTVGPAAAPQLIGLAFLSSFVEADRCLLSGGACQTIVKVIHCTEPLPPLSLCTGH